MDKLLETPPRNPTEFIEKTPPQTLKLDKSSTPNPLKVPQSFKYPERYMSPTDLMMSPVSKGLLARSKKPGVLIPPTINPPKILEPCFQDEGLSQN
ncbi:hypothetical protein BVC80_9083g118 [Macleaya cordata]|uniref:Uncharacterized protein n=1 Tax=Macleaya cordata TaxID=56857 RepID=A0A200PRG3_MACCD|nr:hypothetical protein BVC80_9083g118 [Macleaya cordata]